MIKNAPHAPTSISEERIEVRMWGVRLYASSFWPHRFFLAEMGEIAYEKTNGIYGEVEGNMESKMR